MIVVDGFTKLYGDLVAVENLSFAVGPSEVLGLVGPNGAGKTTTLRALDGIIAPTSGRIAIAGHELAREPVEAKRRLAFIPDEPPLFACPTVEEHLRFIGRMYGIVDAPTRIPGLLQELELQEKQRALPTELSRGMRQKLAIAGGLLHAPAALILDEPLTGLDPAGMRRMRETIAARARGRRGAPLLAPPPPRRGALHEAARHSPRQEHGLRRAGSDRRRPTAARRARPRGRLPCARGRRQRAAAAKAVIDALLYLTGTTIRN